MTPLTWQAGSVDVDHHDAGGAYKVAIGYDVVEPAAADARTETLLLVMGLSTQCIFWPDEFVARFVDKGFRVVRFDNRDIGRSGSVDRGVKVNVTKDFIVSRATFFSDGIVARSNYTLDDMVADTRALLDHLKIAKAHVLGISMGGIIAQMLAAKHRERIHTLSLIMSHTNHRLWGTPHPKVLLSIGPPPPGSSRDVVIERQVRTFQDLLGSPDYRRSDDELRHAFSVAYDRDHRVDGMERQTHALFASPCIDPLLPSIRAPTTVLHGLADRLVLPINSRRIAARITGARLTMFTGMGHDFPPALLPRWAELVLENMARV